MSGFWIIGPYTRPLIGWRSLGGHLVLRRRAHRCRRPVRRGQGFVESRGLRTYPVFHWGRARGGRWRRCPRKRSW